ncbi:hypothetical protein IFR05_014969 [Cadophora sp. M221]|nr:hypothetical protein IFR05_014969 [Cadophora sp. M221]
MKWAQSTAKGKQQHKEWLAGTCDPRKHGRPSSKLKRTMARAKLFGSATGSAEPEKAVEPVSEGQEDAKIMDGWAVTTAIEYKGNWDNPQWEFDCSLPTVLRLQEQYPALRQPTLEELFDMSTTIPITDQAVDDNDFTVNHLASVLQEYVERQGDSLQLGVVVDNNGAQIHRSQDHLAATI